MTQLTVPRAGNIASTDAGNSAAKEERRRIAKVQELENKIAVLEGELAQLAFRLENPPADPARVGQLGKEYARVQHEMDMLLSDWERLQK